VTNAYSRNVFKAEPSQPRAKRGCRILLIGYFGRGNVGDDAMWQALRTYLAGELPSARVRSLPLPAMGRSSGREALHFLRTMRWADTIVLAGGSHFHDRYGTRSLRILLTFIVLFGCARALGARVCYAGVGIGPFRGRLPRVAMRALVRVADGILVRDAPSAIEARRAGAAGV